MRRLSRGMILLLVIFFLLLTLVIGYIYINTESYTTIIVKPKPYKVRTNPYLAAEHFLTANKQKVTSRKHLNFFDKLPTTKQTVLLLGEHSHLTPPQNKKILDWVSNGGQLIVEINHNKDYRKNAITDPLLNDLGIELAILKMDNPDKELPTKLYIENETTPITLNFLPYYALINTDNKATLWANDDKDNTHILQLPHHKGRITVISDANLWKNKSIEQHDHAWLLRYLTTGNDVVLVYNSFSQTQTEHPNFFVNLFKHFPYTLLALILLIIAVLWYKGMRSGPLEALFSRNRRRLPEQLSAQANFLYKKIGATQLIAILQQDINYLAKKRHPRFDDLPIDEQHHLLSKLTQHPIATISQVMGITDQQKLSKLEFIDIVTALQAIRNTL
ncbi:DUF4350 domain-containing protein [Entomomonas asaccharolytica]|uniref:DUF4350 domain-containing protein n=1 Tax=Entomomonas asaccharolytica TaxID=2785331 RepID=A0A974RWF5_9GAMM|nr:DUF4350 domain-containing protein [Entomomonas asaccharolytica]QQP85161.1 DUF4350 domain-containing protein [Entomomonas asaccharolytica]